MNKSKTPLDIMEFFVESRLLFWHIPTGRAVHYIFSFPKEGKEKDVISMPYAGEVSEDDLV